MNFQEFGFLVEFSGGETISANNDQLCQPFCVNFQVPKNHVNKIKLNVQEKKK